MQSRHWDSKLTQGYYCSIYCTLDGYDELNVAQELNLYAGPAPR